MSNPEMNIVGWFEVYVNDMARAKSFYESVFSTSLTHMGMPDGSEMEMFASSMTAYGAPGALVKAEGFPAGKNSVIVYFSCQDCSTEESRVEAAGGKVAISKFSIGEHGFISLIHDSEGNMIGLHSMK